jgi:hypothetical protein
MTGGPSPELDRRFVRGLSWGRGRDRILEEVRDHLEEAALAEERAGLDPDAARRRAIERFGDAEAVAAAFPEPSWYWLPAALALAAAVALVLVAREVAGEVNVACDGLRHVFCSSAVPIASGAQAHPLRARLDTAATRLPGCWQPDSPWWRGASAQGVAGRSTLQWPARSASLARRPPPATRPHGRCGSLR